MSGAIDCRCGKCGNVFRAKPTGGHRVICGDSTAPQVVNNLLDGAKPNLLVSDPPYGVEYDADWRRRAGIGSEGAARGAVLNDDRADWRDAWRLFPGAVAYVWHAGTQAADVALSLRSMGFAIRAQIVWVKQRLVIGRGDYHHAHEPAFYAVREGDDADEDWQVGYEADHEIASYAVRKGQPGVFVGGRKQSTVWHIDHMKSETGHSTQKPVEAMRRPILNNSQPGARVYDPFLGSGTTVIAAEMEGRVCLGVELNPAYVDVIVRRWQAFTGKQAVLEHDGRTFAEVDAGRPKGQPGAEAAEEAPDSAAA